MSAESHLRSEKITINISGRRFETLRSTLEKHPETLLGSNKRELFYDVDSKEYFFDRDSDAFKYILNYYRTGQLHHPRHECLTSFDEELKFYRVSPSVISHCCYGAYQNQKIKTNEEGKTVEELDSTVPPPNNTRERIWRAFENPRSSTCASVLFGFIVSSIAVAILASVAASGKSFRLNYFLQLFTQLSQSFQFPVEYDQVVPERYHVESATKLFSSLLNLFVC